MPILYYWVYNIYISMEKTKKKSNFAKFMLLWGGELVSSVGGGLTSFGLGVYVFQQTGSAASMALVTLLGFLPNVFLSMPAGILADKYDRRVLMMLGDGLSAIGVIYILVCMLNGGAELWQICLGTAISSIFSSLLEPSYRATITDLLTKDEYSKASGLVGLAGSARYLISPFLAGLLLSISNINLLLIIDICTFFVTVIATAVVKKGLKTKIEEDHESFRQSFKTGWKAIYEREGVFRLVLISALVTLFMGAFQVLAEPLVLSFESSTVLGIAESVCATGMLVTSIYLGARGLKKNFTKILSLSLAFAGLAIIGFGAVENIYIICIFGFLFFAALPFANNCLDYLARTNIPDKLQGRAWGIIGFMSQLGYIVAYAVSGVLADFASNVFGISVGRGAGIVVVVSGVIMILIALPIMKNKKIKALEYGEELNLTKGKKEKK